MMIVRDDDLREWESKFFPPSILSSPFFISHSLPLEKLSVVEKLDEPPFRDSTRKNEFNPFVHEYEYVIKRENFWAREKIIIFHSL